jgi:hypothetical protein
VSAFVRWLPNRQRTFEQCFSIFRFVENAFHHLLLRIPPPFTLSTCLQLEPSSFVLTRGTSHRPRWKETVCVHPDLASEMSVSEKSY